MNKSSFPKDFWWGASTSAHQVEGGNRNDWTEWEKRNASRLAKKAQQRPNFPEVSDPNNYRSRQAADHYHMFASDFQLARQLGHNAHRFSIEWSRIEPEPGKYNQKEIAHYQNVISSLKVNHLEPFVTLWHFTLPIWAAERGGWSNPQIQQAFARYSALMVRSLPEVTYWITLNEPLVYAGQAFWEGVWPPGKRHDLFGFWQTIGGLIRAHRLAYQHMKRCNGAVQIGIAKHQIYFEAVNNRLWNRILRLPRHWFWNRYFLERIAQYQDFIGINHYFHDRIDGWYGHNQNQRVSDYGWELYPEGLYWVIREVADFKKPIIITEHGLADVKDRNRAWFIEQTIHWLGKALAEGYDLHGYLHWSLLDNFEWADGFWPRFGLIQVDYQTQQRTIRKSAQRYSQLLRFARGSSQRSV